MRRWFQEVWNERREETMDELCSRDVIIHGLGDIPCGIEGFRQGWRSTLATFDDFRIDVEDMVASGDRVCSRLTLSGVHVGPGLGVMPSGRRISFATQTFGQWRDGQIAVAWNVFDMAAAYRQIGSTII